MMRPQRHYKRALLGALAGIATTLSTAQELGIPQSSGAHARSVAAKSEAQESTVYVAAAVSDGGLTILQSRDGRVFTSIAADAYAPPGGVRDPVLTRGADGAWYLAHDGGLARSTDLRHWQPAQGGAGDAHANPAFSIDAATGRAWRAGAAGKREDLVGLPAGLRGLSVVASPAASVTAALRPRGPAHKITFDQYSMKVDGRRVVLWSGEIHPFRLPNPALWRDVIQKMKALGFNAVSFYFDWAYHSPAPGVYDFTQVRNVERALEIAEQEGMYVIARPGPYVNAG